jgi:hypothetical protein
MASPGNRSENVCDPDRELDSGSIMMTLEDLELVVLVQKYLPL